MYEALFNKIKNNSPAFLAGIVVNQTRKLDKVKEFLAKNECELIDELGKK